MTELNKLLGNSFSQIISFFSVKEHKSINLHHFILNFVLKIFKRNCAFDLFKDVAFKYYRHIQEGKHIIVSTTIVELLLYANFMFNLFLKLYEQLSS